MDDESKPYLINFPKLTINFQSPWDYRLVPYMEKGTLTKREVLTFINWFNSLKLPMTFGEQEETKIQEVMYTILNECKPLIPPSLEDVFGLIYNTILGPETKSWFGSMMHNVPILTFTYEQFISYFTANLTLDNSYFPQLLYCNAQYVFIILIYIYFLNKVKWLQTDAVTDAVDNNMLMENALIILLVVLFTDGVNTKLWINPKDESIIDCLQTMLLSIGAHRDMQSKSSSLLKYVEEKNLHHLNLYPTLLFNDLSVKARVEQLLTCYITSTPNLHQGDVQIIFNSYIKYVNSKELNKEILLDKSILNDQDLIAILVRVLKNHKKDLIHQSGLEKDFGLENLFK